VDWLSGVGARGLAILSADEARLAFWGRSLGPKGPLRCCHPLPAMSTLPPTDEPAAPSAAGVDYPEVPTTAIPALQASPILRRVPRSSLGQGFGHVSFLRRSSCVYRFRCRPPVASPVAFTPTMDAATAQPTRQSSQWLSGLDGLGRHSWTVRP
jgi:hypothetical protein